MKKLTILMIFIFTLMTVSAVSAADNATDVVGDDITDAVVLNEEEVDGNGSDSGGDEVPLQDSEMSASAVTGYETFSTSFVVKLTSNGTGLASKNVIINVNGKNYTRTTDNAGKATLSIKLAKGTYNVNYYYLGDNSTNPSNGKSKITIKSATKTKLVIDDKYINYRQGLKSIFTVRLLTSAGKPVKGQTITFKVNGNTKTAKTNSAGRASVYLCLKKGTYKVTYSFKAKSPYLKSSGSFKVKVKPAMAKGNGYWVWGDMMKSVNLGALKSAGTKHIFLNAYAFTMYGSSQVKSWISTANRYGIKVHIWMQIFYEGKWVRPVNDDGTYKYAYMNKKINQAKTYAKIPGVAGIHFDYLRFGGTAHYYDTSEAAINYFVKKACNHIRSVSPNCIISAAVMPEPGMMEYYYGQDIPTISKYLDVIVPMAYKGNYHKGTSWIKYVTNSFVLQSNSAQVWTGIQSYKSDDNPVRLSHSDLLKDAKAAMAGGAKGVVLFRWGISNILNFNKV